MLVDFENQFPFQQNNSVYMKLVLIISDYGAFNNFLTELSSVIAGDEKHTVHIICSKSKVINIDDKLISQRQNINFHYVDIPRTTSLVGEIRAASKIRSLVTAINPDLIHSHFTTGTFPAVLFRKRRYTYWSTIHGLGMNSSTGLKKLIFALVETICFIRLDKIFVVNDQDYNLVNKLFSKKVLKYDCFGFGCDIEKFDPANFSEQQKFELKEKIGIKAGTIVIAFTGRYVHFKGFHLVVQSFQKLIKEYPGKFKLILMGGFDPIHKTGLDKEGEAFFNTSKDIINLGFTSDVYKYLSITDIFLFPSKKEGLPTCILESLAMGVPVITFNVRGNKDIVKNNYNGILIDPHEEPAAEIDSIKNSLKKLAFDGAERAEFSNNALNDRLKYSRNNFINEHLKYYSALNGNGVK
jgi:glycosyltransferase involved in cell wall biosynthesis